MKKVSYIPTMKNCRRSENLLRYSIWLLVLPIDETWEDPDTYIKALLSFSTSLLLFMNLCGRVYMVDFLTCDPDVYITFLKIGGTFPWSLFQAPLSTREHGDISQTTI